MCGECCKNILFSNECGYVKDDETFKEMQKKHDKNMKKQQDDKKEIERKIDESTKRITEDKQEKNKVEDDISYEFEYDETLEDE